MKERTRNPKSVIGLLLVLAGTAGTASGHAAGQYKAAHQFVPNHCQPQDTLLHIQAEKLAKRLHELDSDPYGRPKQTELLQQAVNSKELSETFAQMARCIDPSVQ